MNTTSFTTLLAMEAAKVPAKTLQNIYAKVLGSVITGMQVKTKMIFKN